MRETLRVKRQEFDQLQQHVYHMDREQRLGRMQQSEEINMLMNELDATKLENEMQETVQLELLENVGLGRAELDGSEVEIGDLNEEIRSELLIKEASEQQCDV